MTVAKRPPPTTRSLPRAGVLRFHHDPTALPPLGGQRPNRFDDPRPSSETPFRVRYAGTTLRGCLLESLDWLRPHPEAVEREETVVDDAEPRMETRFQPWAGLEDFIKDRQVAQITARGLRLLSIDDPILQAVLDREPAVRALLDSPEGRMALAGQSSRAHLDQAAVRLSTEFGRRLTQACSLAVWDRDPQPDGIHYRSRHDDVEDCWAIYDHASVTVHDAVSFSAQNVVHRTALRSVATLWGLELPPEWA